MPTRSQVTALAAELIRLGVAPVDGPAVATWTRAVQAASIPWPESGHLEAAGAWRRWPTAAEVEDAAWWQLAADLQRLACQRTADSAIDVGDVPDCGRDYARALVRAARACAGHHPDSRGPCADCRALDAEAARRAPRAPGVAPTAPGGVG